MTFPLASSSIVKPRLGRWLALALLLSTASPLCALNTPQRPGTATGLSGTAERSSTAGRYRGPRTYLAMLGAAPVRFLAAAPALPPEPEMPKPLPPPPAPPETVNATVAEPVSTPQESGLEGVKPSDAPEIANPVRPVSILPDDIPQDIRAEDVIPFFQFPGGGADGVSVAVPYVPAQPRAPGLPPSSATYQQR